MASIEDDTIVIFTSDNGGLSHNYGTRAPVTNNAPLRRGKGLAYEGALRVPLIVRWPGVTPSGAVCDSPVSGVNLLPTLAGGLDLETDAAAMDGVDLRTRVRSRHFADTGGHGTEAIPQRPDGRAMEAH